jgi:hypothetical protein
MKNIGKLLFILGILGNSIALNASCISNITSSSKYFINTSSSTFQTNDIQKAEENANFTLMFPNYLPECIDHQVKINGYLSGQQYLDETKVIFKIQYSGNKGNNCIVLIDERKGPITSLPSSKENSNNINVLGIDILEERRTILLSNSGPVAGISYDWEQNGTHVTLAVSNDDKTDIISRTEAINIIESMIK